MNDGIDQEEEAPRVFISYRWSSPSHEEWVLRLAASLRASGIDVKLDKWHLKEGQDTLAFMESMVNDQSVKKVLMICDHGYVERANSREGGVGTEAQIISSKVYNDTGQDKFAAVVVGLDETGMPILPTYMSTRLYFDMSSDDSQAINFEKVVRWIFDEPFHALPPIGKRPDFLGKTYITGSPLFSVASSSGQSSLTRISNSAEGVLQSIVEESKSFHLTLVDVSDAAEQVYKGIKETRPVSENAYRAIRDLISHPSENVTDIIHAFFEKLLMSWDRSSGAGRFSSWDADVYKYFVHDLFVSFVAIAFEQRAFKLCGDTLSMPFYKPNAHERTGAAADYTSFRSYIESLDSKSKLMGRLSVHADLLNEAHEHSIVGQTFFMEADLTLHLRGILAPKLQWYPVSGLYLANSYGALPTYVRSKSTRFYERLRPVLLDKDAESLRGILVTESNGHRSLTFDYRTLDVGRLIAAPDLATTS